MIGSLKGVVEFLDTQNILIDVSGVGYKVNVSKNVITKYHSGDKIKAYIHTHVREDVLDLYGFESIEELKLFEAFLGVSGIGPKTAIGIFVIGTKEQILFAIKKADVSFFVK